MSVGLSRLVKIDPLLKVEVDKEFGQTVLSGMGEVHLEVMIERLKDEFNVKVKTEEPRVPYRETITATAEAQGKYKRQSGCLLYTSPSPRDISGSRMPSSA